MLVIDNGSRGHFRSEAIAAFGPNFPHCHMRAPSPSPARAINYAASQARGDLLAIMIDGARMLSPGVVRYSLDAARLGARPVIGVFSWHLGPTMQFHSVLRGYNQAAEDQLLASVRWQEDGYELFAISALAGSARRGVFRNPGESNFLVLRRSEMFTEIGGMDERFDLPGGGLANHDLLARALAAPEARFILLLGEGTFHQYPRRGGEWRGRCRAGGLLCSATPRSIKGSAGTLSSGQ